MYSSILVFAKKTDGNASTFLCHNIRTTQICLSSELWLLLINQSSTNNNNNNNYLNCQFHNLNNVFCCACKQKTHLKASVGNEGELQSLVGLLDPVSENKSTDMSVCCCQCDFKLLYCNTWNLGACVEVQPCRCVLVQLILKQKEPSSRTGTMAFPK